LLNSTEFGPFNKRREIKSGKPSHMAGNSTVSVGTRSNIKIAGGGSSMKVG